MSIRLNVGCGPIQPEGWVNIDNSNRAKLAANLPWLNQWLVWLKVFPPTEYNNKTSPIDIRKTLPFDGESVSAVYCGEVLEHLIYPEGLFFLKECFRILIPGGILRVRVPDNYDFWKNYCCEYEQTHSLPREKWNEGHTRWIDMFFRDICIKRPWFGSMGHYHKWMYDEISLVLMFEKVKFINVERKGYHESGIPEIDLIEVRGDLQVEGVKPK